MIRDPRSPAGLSSSPPPPLNNGPYPSSMYSPYMRRVSPPGSPKCCYKKRAKQRNESFLCCCCYTCPADNNSPRHSTSVLATLAVCALVLGYTILGAFIFMSLEGHNKDGLVNHPVTDLRTHTVDRLWSITENLNILYRENWTRLAAEEVFEFQESLFRQLQSTGLQGYHHRRHRWTFSSSFLYSLTLITTIGYGSVSPRTTWGKLATIVYALVGIPLMLLYLSTTGDVLARSFRRLYGKACGPSAQKSSQCSACNAPVRVPVTLCLVIVVAYICSGALLFHRLENWTILEGSYFCFTSLGTIGFGDLLPGQRTQEEEVSLCACAAYILTGMALVAMCFSLLQDEVLSLLRLVGATTRPEDALHNNHLHGLHNNQDILHGIVASNHQNSLSSSS